MQHIVKDITTVSAPALILHIVNNLNSMGAGVAKSLYTKWPYVKQAYHERSAFLEKSTSLDTLGHVHIYEVCNQDGQVISVGNLYAQDGFGWDGSCYLSYEALEKCLSGVKKHLDMLAESGRPTNVYVPYLMGCGLAGGDWEKVVVLLEKHIPEGVVCKV